MSWQMPHFQTFHEEVMMRRPRICKPPIFPTRDRPEELPDVTNEEHWDAFDRAARVRNEQACAAYDAMRWQRAVARARRLQDGRVAIDLGLVFG